MRAVVYARFSTDNQSASSIDDQAALCRSRARALGIDVAAVYSDAATSGQSRFDERPGGRAMLADSFDVLMVESLDRLSRDSVDAERLVRRLEHRGVRIVGVSDGYDTESGKSRKLLRMVRGAISETYVDDIREKTIRAMHGQFDRGFHLTGISYGYRSVVVGVDARGEPIGHRLEVVPEQADVVREIYARYGAGESCQRIAFDLNARGVPAPRGRTWCVSALYGSPAKGSGILNNDLYDGRYVWNRSRWIKHPDTGKRERQERPRAEWRIEDRPELRIVTPAAWQAVRERMNRARQSGGRAGRGGVPTTLFGGLLRCGKCGGAVVAVSSASYGCAARMDRGPTVCEGVRAPRKRTDELLLWHVRKALESPAVVRAIETAAAAELARRARASDEVEALGGRVRELEAEVARLADAIAVVGISDALTARLRQAEAALRAARSAHARAGVPTVPAQARKLVARVLDDLAGRLKGDLPAARDALRAALGDVTVTAENDETFAEFEDTAGRLLRAAVGGSADRVAGACYPTRLRLSP